MDKERFDKGREIRSQVLGTDYVTKALENADDFSHGFQELVTEYAWGEIWGNEDLSRRDRSLLNLAMTAASGRMEEFELHFRGAFKNGVTRKELRATLMQISVYCGMPAGVSSFRIAKRILAEMDAEES